MKHTVQHACGHPAEHDLDGAAGFQAWEARRRAAGPCPSCFKAGVDSENALNAAFAVEQDLPELVGTAKQIEWAVSIRAAFLAELPDQLRRLREVISARGGAELPAGEAALELVAKVACREIAAAWWIRNRFKVGDSLIQRHRATWQSGDPGETGRRLLLWTGRQ